MQDFGFRPRKYASTTMPSTPERGWQSNIVLKKRSSGVSPLRNARLLVRLVCFMLLLIHSLGPRHQSRVGRLAHSFGGRRQE